MQRLSIQRLSPSCVIKYMKAFSLLSLLIFLPTIQICFYNNQQERRLVQLTKIFFPQLSCPTIQLSEFTISRPTHNSSILTVNTGSSRAWASAITSLRKEENQLIAVMHQFQQKNEADPKETSQVPSESKEGHHISNLTRITETCSKNSL